MNQDEQAILRNAWRLATKDAEDYALLNAELLGRVNKLTEAAKNLEGIVRSYETMARGYDHKAATLRDERDRARALAAALENECNNCWGPVHSMVISEARMQSQYPYPTSPVVSDVT